MRFWLDYSRDEFVENFEGKRVIVNYDGKTYNCIVLRADDEEDDLIIGENLIEVIDTTRWGDSVITVGQDVYFRVEEVIKVFTLDPSKYKEVCCKCKKPAHITMISIDCSNMECPNYGEV